MAQGRAAYIANALQQPNNLVTVRAERNVGYFTTICRDYSVKAIDSSFRKVNWNQASTSDATCWRLRTSLSQMTRSFVNIADASFTTETHLEQISYGEASTSRSTSCGRLGEVPGGPSSSQKPSSQFGANCRCHLFHDGDCLRSHHKESPKQWAFPSPVVTQALSAATQMHTGPRSNSRTRV